MELLWGMRNVDIHLLLAGQTLWNIPLFLILFGLMVMYFYIFRKKRYIFKSTSQLWYFYLSMIIIYLAYGSPLAVISHVSMSLHMVKMALLYFICAPLLLLSLPSFRSHPKKSFAKPYITFSIITLMLFAGLFFIYHLPFVMHGLMVHSHLHTGYIALLFLLSLGMWLPFCWAPLARAVAKESLSKFAVWNSIGVMPACFIIIIGAFFIEGVPPMHAHLAAELSLPHGTEINMAFLPPAFDQFLAGAIMIVIHKLSMTKWG